MSQEPEPQNPYPKVATFAQSIARDMKAGVRFKATDAIGGAASKFAGPDIDAILDMGRMPVVTPVPRHDAETAANTADTASILGQVASTLESLQKQQERTAEAGEETAQAVQELKDSQVSKWLVRLGIIGGVIAGAYAVLEATGLIS